MESSGSNLDGTGAVHAPLVQGPHPKPSLTHTSPDTDASQALVLASNVSSAAMATGHFAFKLDKQINGGQQTMVPQSPYTVAVFQH